MYIFFLALSLFSTEIKRPDFIETEPFFLRIVLFLPDELFQKGKHLHKYHIQYKLWSIE